ncbi:MAG: hypothetical protein WCV67_09715 [Victivallaceae bacterium]|jgi:hypothetical protein
MNRIRRIVITFLIVISIAGIIHFTSNKTGGAGAANTTEVAPPADGPELKAAAPEPAQNKKILTVYCFTDNQNGKSYESFVREAVERDFTDGLKSGVIVIKVIDAGSAEKPPLAVSPPAVVMAASAGGQPAVWRNLDKTGALISDKNAFLNYIRDNIRDFMEKNIQ